MKFNKRILLLLLVLSLLMISSAFSADLIDYTADSSAFYRFSGADDGTDALLDLSPNGNDLTNVGGATWSTTTGFTFDGTNDQLQASDDATLDLNADDFVICSKPQFSDLNDRFISKGTSGNGGWTYGLNAGKLFDFFGGTASQIGVRDSNVQSDTSNFHTWCAVIDRDSTSGTKIYLDGTEVSSYAYGPFTSTTDYSNTDVMSIGYGGTFWAGDMKNVYIWKGSGIATTYTSAVMTEIHNKADDWNPFATAEINDILTVNFQNALTLTNISDVVVNYDGTNYTNVTGNQVKINITTAGGNISLLQNFTVYAEDHFSDDVSNWNISDIYVANLTQSDINYSISEIYTGNAINTFNLTLSNSTKYQTTNGTINLGLNTGSQTFLIEPLNYDAQNVSYTITAKEVSNVTFNDFANGTLELHLVQQQNTNISVSAFTASFTPNGTEQVYPTSNGSVFIPVLFGDTYQFTFTSAGYFTGYENITINQSYQNETYNLSLQGGVLFTFRDSVTQNIITGELNLIVENATFSQTYTFTGGTQIVTNLTDAQEFDFYFYGAGYQTNSYFLTYQNQTEIDLYLINGSDNITYTVLTQGSEVLPDTEITIDKFLSGSWVQIASQLTDVTGRAVFGLERGITHRITFNKDGYTSRVDINRFSDTDFTVVLAESAEINFDLGFQDVRLVVSPSNSTLLPKLTNFSASITSAQALFEYILLKVYYNGTLLGQDNSTSNVGANLNVNLDLTSYNDTLIMLEYTYKVINVSEITYGTKVYKVVDTVFYEGTLLELKDRLDEKLSIGEKIALYAIVFILTLIFVSIFATGLPAVVASLLIATLAGWVFGINIVLLLFVTATVTIFSIAYAGDMI